jgi:3-oxoacyl-[acyl-carrier-protein] synthase II
VKLAFGEAHAGRLLGHSVKSMIGHPQGACGLASLVATVGGMAGLDGSAGFLPPTAHLREADPECDLDYTPLVARDVGGRWVALVNCLAFGAKNSALVVRAG